MICYKKLFDEIRSFSKRGLFHIVGSSILSQLCGLISSIVVIRHLAKTDYGYYVEANNLYSYFAIFIGIGYAVALLQFCSEDIGEKKKRQIYRFTLLSGTLFNYILAILIFLFGVYESSVNAEVGYYIKLMCFFPFVVYFHQYFQMVFRTQRNNKFFSFINSFYSISIVLFNIVFTYLWGVRGLVLSTYAANGIIIIAQIIYLVKSHFFVDIKNICTEKLGKKDKIEISKYALTTSITNFASTILILLDITCLGIILQSPEVLADYKVAATIPNAFGFIPSSLMVYFYPELVKKYSGGYRSLIEYIKYLLRIYLITNGIVFIILFIFSKQIIYVVYGEKYQNIVPIFRVLSLNYLVSSCGRKILGNAVAVTRRVQINLYFSIISGLFNIGLNIILISKYDSFGAALATFFVTILLVMMYVLYFYIKYKNEDKKEMIRN